MSEDKELPASGKRRRDLREKGQVVRSMDMGTTALLGTGLISLLTICSGMGDGFAKLMVSCFTAIGSSSRISDPAALLSPLGETNLPLYLGGFFLLISAVVFAIHVLQVGVQFSSEPLNFNLNILNPVTGMQKFFSLKRLVMVSMSVVKLIVIGFFVYTAVKSLFTEAVFVRPVNVDELGKFFLSVSWSIGWRVLLALVLISAVDYLYQWWQFEKDNRMSFQEVKDELKQTEGNPEIKARRRRMMRRKSVRRMLEDMSDATVVVTNPTHYAVALKYRKGQMKAPVIVAMGMRLIAKRIKERAIDLHVPMIENRPLARGLHKHGKVGKEIPVLYYQAVAVVLAQLLRRGMVETPEVNLEDEADEQ